MDTTPSANLQRRQKRNAAKFKFINKNRLKPKIQRKVHLQKRKSMTQISDNSDYPNAANMCKTVLSGQYKKKSAIRNTNRYLLDGKFFKIKPNRESDPDKTLTVQCQVCHNTLYSSNRMSGNFLTHIKNQHPEIFPELIEHRLKIKISKNQIVTPKTTEAGGSGTVSTSAAIAVPSPSPATNKSVARSLATAAEEKKKEDNSHRRPLPRLIALDVPSRHSQHAVTITLIKPTKAQIAKIATSSNVNGNYLCNVTAKPVGHSTPRDRGDDAATATVMVKTELKNQQQKQHQQAKELEKENQSNNNTNSEHGTQIFTEQFSCDIKNTEKGENELKELRLLHKTSSLIKQGMVDFKKKIEILNNGNFEKRRKILRVNFESMKHEEYLSYSRSKLRTAGIPVYDVELLDLEEKMYYLRRQVENPENASFAEKMKNAVSSIDFLN